MYRLILEYLLRAFLREDGFTALNVRSFQDRADRTDKFVNALKDKKPLTLVKGGDPVVVTSVEIIKKGKDKEMYDPIKQAEELKQVLPTLVSGDKLYLYAGDTKYSITTVAKTAELGGKGKGGTLGPERAAIKALQEQFDQIGTPIKVAIRGAEGTVYSGITGVVNVKENQKADFALAAGTAEKVFISYKPGSSVKSVISYGGITEKSSTSHDEVAAFVKAVKERVSSFKGLGYEFGVPVKEPIVAQKAIYGKDFGSGEYGINNVQALMQGNVRLVQEKDDLYILESDHTVLSPTIPDGDYTPYLNARFAGDRNQFGIENCRVGVVPMGARKNIRSPFDSKPQDEKPTT